jgi:FMN phosphatase YigB (HAD superfamily)
MALDAVLLDLGNVLVLHDNALLLRRFASRAGMEGEQLAARLPTDFWDRINRGQLDEAGIRATFERASGAALTPEEFFELWNCHFTLHEAVFPQVEALLGRVRVVLLSNTNAAHMRWVRQRLPLLARFDGLVLSHEVHLAKPDPAIFHEALRLAGAAPGRAAFFDDMPEYVEAATRLGIQGRLFTSAEQFGVQLRALGV